MSVQALGWVFDNSPTRGYDRLALLAIANHADKFGGNAYPGYSTIGEDGKMSRRNAVYAVQRLEAGGHIFNDPGAGPHGSNLYEIIGMPAHTARLARQEGSAKVALAGEGGGEQGGERGGAKVALGVVNGGVQPVGVNVPGAVKPLNRNHKPEISEEQRKANLARIRAMTQSIGG